MTLSEYLDQNKKNASDFAALLGCETSTITRILRGERTPSLGMALRIEEKTKGLVTPKDFEVKSSHPEAQAS